jgi:hypothetical protein
MSETKYTLYPEAEQVSRPRYFNGQFLGTQDFVDEQRYHADRLRRSLRHVRLAGVSHGLGVVATAPLELRVDPGTAIDDGGRQIVLTDPRGRKLPADLPRPADYVVAIAYAERGDRTQGGQQGGLGAEGDTRLAEDPTIALYRSDQPLAAGHVALALLAVAADGTITVRTPPEVRRYAGLRLPGPGGVGPELTTGGDPDPRRLRLAGDLTVRDGLVVQGTARLAVAHVETRSFTLAGDTDKFYPVVFSDDGWADGACTLELSRADVHADGEWRGSLMARFVWHSTRWGHGSDFDAVELHQHRQRFVARYAMHAKAAELVVWLRGKSTYRWRANHSTSLVYAEAAPTARGDLALAVLPGVDPELDRDRLAIGPPLQYARVRGPLNVDADLAYGGKLTKLDVADAATATVRAADFCLGFSARRGSPGRALVDAKDALIVNYGNDWPKLTLAGEVAVPATLTVGQNPLWLTSGWSGRPDQVTNTSEIANDTAQFKTLMIIGNRAAGLGRRVSVWDRLEVNSYLLATSNIAVGIAPEASPKAALHVNGRIYLEHGVIQRGGDPIGGSDLGLYSQVASSWVRYVSNAGRHVFFTDGGAGTVERMSVDPNGEVKVPGALVTPSVRAGNITLDGTLSKLDVADAFAATIRAADLYLGFSGRRGAPGRALVDAKDALIVNCGPDWPRVQIQSELELLGALNLRSTVFKVPGDNTRFYPVLFAEQGWVDGPATIEVTRADVHRDSNAFGAVQLRARWHPSRWGNGGEFDELEVYQYVRRFVARHYVVFRSGELVLWLRGGTTYNVRGERQAITIVSNTGAQVTHSEETFPVLNAVDAYLDLDRVRIAPQVHTRVRGRLTVDDGVIQRGGAPLTGTVTLGLYSQVAGEGIRHVTTAGPHQFFVDGGVGSAPRLTIAQDGQVWAASTVNAEQLRSNTLAVAQTATLPGLHVTSREFVVGGSFDQFYPVVIADSAWYDGPCVAEITRADVHRNSEARGSLQALLRWHGSNWGHGSDFVEVEVYSDYRRFVARTTVIIQTGELVVWLRGGNTTYNLRGRTQPVTIAANTTAQTTRGEQVLPVLSAVDKEYEQTRVHIAPVGYHRFPGTLALDNGVIQRGGEPITATADLGLYSQVEGAWIRFVTRNAAYCWFGDGGIGTSPRMTLQPYGTLSLLPTTFPALRIHNFVNPDGSHFNIGFEGGNNTVVFYHQDGRGQYMRPDGVWYRNSDRALKHDIRPLEGALDLALALRPVRFTWNDLDAPGIGFIAQEVAGVLPEFVCETSTGAPPGEKRLGVSYEAFGPIAIAAIQQLAARYDRRIAELEAQLRELALARRS